MLLENTIKIGENGFLEWVDKDYIGEFSKFRTMIEEGNVLLINDTVLMWNFPVSIFDSFKEVYILTYLFDAQIQRYYYDMFKMDYTYKSTNGEELLEYDKNGKYKGNITVIDNPKLNAIGDNTYSLSSTWYDREENAPLISKMKKNLHNYFNNITKNGSEYNMWTCFKKSKEGLTKKKDKKTEGFDERLFGFGYSKGFVSVNARATSKYNKKNTLAIS